MRVLSRPSFEKDFKFLFSLSNIRGIFYQLEGFAPPKVPRLNFRWSWDVQAKKQVQARLLVQVKEASTEEMIKGNQGDMYPLAAPLARPTLPLRSKRPREGELESVAELRQ